MPLGRKDTWLHCSVFLGIQRKAARIPRLVCLPAMPAIEIQTGQPSLPCSSGVNADGVANVFWVTTSLWRVSTHHDSTRFVGLHILESFPEQHRVGLFFQIQVAACIGVDTEVRFILIVALQLVLQKRQVFRWQFIDTLGVVGREEFIAPEIHPVLVIQF